MKVHLRMTGCRLNQSEIDTMARQLRQQGHEIVADPILADWAIVNTCAVTGDAEKDSRRLIREINRDNPGMKITVTGCYAQLAPDDIRVLPGVAHVIDNVGKDSLVETITGVPVEAFDHEPIARAGQLGAQGRTRAFVKVQDGCDNACTFCITTVARGSGRSRPLPEVIHEIRGLHASGYREAVLTGVHLGSYGHDLGDSNGLLHLVQAVLLDTDIPRVRLSSLEPWDLAAGFFALWDNPRLCRHLHLPLQSGCDSTLKRMLRRTDQRRFGALVQAARQHIPDVSITTDVIVGFPGETDDEFEVSAAFVEQMEFSGLHVFRYSRRSGTPAARMRGQVSETVKKTRATRLLALSERMETNFAQRFVGTTLDVLWENIWGATQDGYVNVGYTDNYIRVHCVDPRLLTNRITPVEIVGYDQEKRRALVLPKIT